MDIESLIRKDLRGWENYQVQPITGRKMDANESPFDLTMDLRKELADWILNHEDFHYYPDTDSTELRKVIGAFYGVKPEQICCTVGSDQMIDYLTKLFLEEGDYILVPAPSFSMYQTAAVINHGKAEAFPLTESEDFAFPTELIIQRVQELQPKILFLCNPNNPTGTLIPKEDIIRILNAVNCIVVLDEAYGEFTGKQETIELLDTYPNVLIMKTFSKSYGLAGLRVGYAIGTEEMIAAIDTIRAPYNLNTFSQVAAGLVLTRPEYQEHIQWIIAERERIYKVMKELEGNHGFYCFPSAANFLLMRSEMEDLGARLLEKGLLVRQYSGAMKQYIRASIADGETNTLFIEAMREILED